MTLTTREQLVGYVESLDDAPFTGLELILAVDEELRAALAERDGEVERLREAIGQVKAGWDAWECQDEPSYCDHMQDLISAVRNLLAAPGVKP